MQVKYKKLMFGQWPKTVDKQVKILNVEFTQIKRVSTFHPLE